MSNFMYRMVRFFAGDVLDMVARNASKDTLGAVVEALSLTGQTLTLDKLAADLADHAQSQQAIADSKFEAARVARESAEGAYKAVMEQAAKVRDQELQGAQVVQGEGNTALGIAKKSKRLFGVIKQ